MYKYLAIILYTQAKDTYKKNRQLDLFLEVG